MPTAAVTPESRERLGALGAVAIHSVIAIALIAVSVSRASIVLPVTLSLPTGGLGVFSSVDLALAAAVVVMISVIARLALTVSGARGASLARRRGVRYLELSQVAGITIVVVALVNGVTEAGILVVSYAIAAATIGALWVQGRGSAADRAAPWHYSASAALAIVPWGVVALYQIVGIALAVPPAPIVRVLTVVILVLAMAMWFVERRWQLGTLTDERTDALHTLLTAANGLALLVLVVGLARPSALL